ncbi:hypothetical protein D9M69_486740 [compost metagenome]
MRAAADRQFAAGQFRRRAQARHPGHAHALQRHALQAVGHRRLVDDGVAQAALAQQQVDPAAEEGAGAVGQQRHALAAVEVVERHAGGVHRADREHLGAAQVQRGEDFRVHLQRRVRVVEGQHQVAAALAQQVHRLADVGRHQAAGDVQALGAQPRDPRREEAQRQRVRGGELQHLALPALQVMQMAHHLAELLDHGTCGDEEQLAGLGQLHRRALAVHQGQAEGILQAADTPAEGRLGDEALFRRLGEAAGGGQRAEVLQPFHFEIHGKAPGTCVTGCTFAVISWSQRTLCRLCMRQRLTALADDRRNP